MRCKENGIAHFSEGCARSAPALRRFALVSNPIGDVSILRFDMFDIPADDNGGGSRIGAARLPPFALCKQYVLLSGFARSE